jgi:hypothetical protein
VLSNRCGFKSRNFTTLFSTSAMSAIGKNPAVGQIQKLMLPPRLSLRDRIAACLPTQPRREMPPILEPLPLFEANPLAASNPHSINPQGVRYTARAATAAASLW